MNAHNDTTAVVEREVRIQARQETVFQFFVDPAKMVQWKGASAFLDPRPGGAYRVSVTSNDVARGEYVEIVPYSKVVFTWGWEGEGGHGLPPGASTVEVNLIPDGEATILRLRHSDLAGTEEQHALGWDHYLPRLVIVAAGGDAGPDPWLDASPAAAHGDQGH